MLMSVAVTGMVVLAFIVPISSLVGDLASDTAINAAERDAESLARVLAVLVLDRSLEESVEIFGEDRIVSLSGSVIGPDDRVFGQDVPADEDLSPARDGRSFIVALDGGAAVYIPLLVGEGRPAVIRVFVTDATMNMGVVQSRVILGLLGLLLVTMGAWIADRLARGIVAPIEALSDTARTLGEGDLDARVRPAGPREVQEMGAEFNRLAEQVGRLLQEERETAADLAHRLRTPLTAARLSLESFGEGPEKDRLAADLDELHRTTNFIIREARRPVRSATGGQCDLNAVVKERTDFWLPLASEQGREVATEVSGEPVVVGIPIDDTAAMVDALLENVLSHTPEGTPLRVSSGMEGGFAVLVVEDGGQGLASPTVAERGASHADSTGLGLDIVRRTAQSAGGVMKIGSSQLGGARIEVAVPYFSNP